MELITPGFGLIFWMTLTFLIVLIILKKYAWKPILESIRQREEFINNSLKQAEEARRQLENVKNEAQKILNQARQEREQMLKEAKEIHARIVRQADEEAKKIKERRLQEALQEIENAKINAVNELKQFVADISIEIAEKILRSELSDKQAQKQFIEKMLKESNLN